MGARGANTFPSCNRLPYLDSLVARPCSLPFVRFSDIPFPYGINILVATLLVFRERATAGDSAGDYLSKSILAFVCFILLGVYLFFMSISCIYVCMFIFCLHIMFISACTP